MTLPADSLCPCQSGKDYAACCEPFAEAPALSGETAPSQARASLRHQLLSLARTAADLPELWFACLDELTEAERIALDGTPALAQPFLEHFLWDWFRKYSEARPISRQARAIESSDLRQSRRLEEWGLASWEPWEVLGAIGGTWELARIGSDRTLHVRPSFEHQIARKGDGIVCRILPHLGHDFTGLSVVRFPGAKGLRHLKSSWTRIAREVGVSTSVRIRPDVHNELWHPIHLALLRLHPVLDGLEEVPVVAELPPSSPDEAALLDQPLDELGHQSPRQAVAHAMGRHRVRRWLERRESEGHGSMFLRRTLGL